ncbi:MAG: glucose 1-dehydrogenase [Acidobacteriia bacterium]|nr:glucose 1-dehydrogenase [Terriglobia bacterium]
MAHRLEGKVAIITGGGSGIGETTAIIFAREGAKVALAGRRVAKIQAVADRIISEGGEALVVQTDVRYADQVQNLVSKTVERFGKLNVLFNNAGVRASRSTVVEVSEEEYERTMATDVKGLWLCCKYAIPEMIRGGGGSIINCSSISAFIGQPLQGVYNVTKGGIDVLSKCMAVDFAKHNIRVNNVNPGWVKTEMNEEELARWKAEGSKELEEVLRLHPLGRLGEPEDVAWAVVYLAADESSWVTGASFLVDGGYCCQ